MNLPDAALDQFRSAVALAPEQDQAWATSQFHLGLALKSLERAEEAARAFEMALAAATDFPEAEDTRRELQALTEPEASGRSS